MTYLADVADAKERAHYKITGVCFECGQAPDGPVVLYDGHNGTSVMSFMLHRSCALIVANRLIADVWPNRHAEPKVSISE